MATEPNEQVQVEFTAEFRRNAKALRKKYRHVESDFKPLLEALESGETPGDQVPGTGLTVFKVRIKNSDIQKGKSSGYRLVYWVPSPTRRVLLACYSKLEQSDVSAQELKQIVKEFEESGGE